MEQKPDYSAPDFTIAEHKKDAEFYKKAIRYYSSFYNRSQTTQATTDNPVDNYNPVDKGLNYLLYYQGKQRNINYNHVTTDITGNTLQAVWIPGKKVGNLIDHRLGYISKQFENKDISVTSLSPEVVSWRERKLQDGLLMFDNEAKDMLEFLAQNGVEFDPMEGQMFETPEEWERYVDTSLKDYGEIIMGNIGRAVEAFNYSNEEYKKAFLHYHAFGWCAMYNEIENGVCKQRALPSWNTFYDTLDDDPLKRKMKFAGFHERLTPMEIFQKYPDLSDEAKSDIERLAESAKLGGGNATMFTEWCNSYNTPTVNYFDFTQGQLVVACTTVYWIAPRDTRYTKTKDNYGKDIIKKQQRKNKKGDYITLDLYKGTLIGNKWLTGAGLANNVVRSKWNKTMPELPIKVFTHNTVVGEVNPPIGKIAQHQDNMDFYRFKVMEIVSRDAGKNYIIHGDKLEGSTSKSMITDFKSIGIHVAIGSSGESDDPVNGKRFVEYVDLTLDPNVMKYVELYREEELIMEKIMSTNQVDMGQQMSYMSQGTQKATIMQTQQGIIDLYQNFTKYNEYCLQHAVEMTKMVWAVNDEYKEKVFIIGDRGVRFTDLTKDLLFQDMLLFINTNDVLDEASRERMKAYAQAWSQNPQLGFSPLDLIKLEQATTYQEMVSIANGAFKRAKREQMEQQMMMQQQQMAMQQANAQAQGDQTMMREAGATERADMNNNTKMAMQAAQQEQQAQEMPQMPTAP